MTGGRLVPFAGAALALAAVGILARPLLSYVGAPGSDAEVAPATAPGVPAALIDAAVRAADAAVACHRGAVRPGCGPLAVTRTDGYRTGASHITVQLIGSLCSSTPHPMPIALRVELSRSVNGWTSAVALP